MKKRISIAIAVLMCVPLLTCCGSKISQDAKNSSEVVSVGGEPEEETTEKETAPLENPVVRIVAAGDNLVQTAVYRTAQAKSVDETYDFSYSYENVKDIISSGDISILNQETLIANDKFEISGSNFNFNSPSQLGDEMIDLGFDVFTMSNNHVLDKGTDGLLATLDYWDSRMAEHDNVRVLGAYRDEMDMNDIRTIESNGMTIAFLGYTEHTNGYSLPADSPIKIVYTDETELMESQIKRAKQMADAVVVSVHWGLEDTHTVSDACRELAQNFVDWGADVVVGTHSHTAETMEYLERDNGSRGFVLYSLGNFISAQTDNFNTVGEIASLSLEKDMVTGEIKVDDIEVTPVITHYDDGSFTNLRLYPYSMYTSELADSHGLPYAPAGTAKTYSMDVINKIIEENIPEEFRKLD